MKKIALFAVFLSLMATGIYADDSAPRVISSISVVQNDPVRTNQGALLRYVDIEEGQLIDSADALAEIIEREVQDLKNTRYFAEVAITAEEAPAGDDGLIPVDLVITTTDAWTLLPIPYPLPDSQIGANGWSFGITIEYNNFFGTMTDFYFDTYVDIAFGEVEKLRGWKINPELKNVKTGNLEFDYKFEQYYDLDQNFYSNGDLKQRYSYYHSSFSIDTDIEFPGDWTYGFEPGFEFNYGYDWTSGGRKYYDDDPYVRDENGVLANREDLFLFTFDHQIQQGRVNWVQSFRSGYKIKLSNKTELGITRPADTKENEFIPITDLNLSASWYVPFAGVLNYYTRGQALFVFGEIRTGLGSNIRGVRNSSIDGNTGFFWQNTLVIQPHRSNAKFNFQFHPFIDMGVAFNYYNMKGFSDIYRLGVGTELVALVGGMELRGRIGLDPINFSEDQFLDISFNTGFSY